MCVHGLELFSNLKVEYPLNHVMTLFHPNHNDWPAEKNEFGVPQMSPSNRTKSNHYTLGMVTPRPRPVLWAVSHTSLGDVVVMVVAVEVLLGLVSARNWRAADSSAECCL